MTALFPGIDLDPAPVAGVRPRTDDARRGGDGARTGGGAHLAPFHLSTSLARSLRPRTGRGRHVSDATDRHAFRLWGSREQTHPGAPKA